MKRFWIAIGYIIVITIIFLLVIHIGSNLDKLATTF